MTVGNLIALRQTNVVRLFAYSSIAQAGYILAPLAVAGDLGTKQDSLSAVVVYLLVYAAMNLGAFGIIITVERRTGSAELDSFNGLFEYARAHRRIRCPERRRHPTAAEAPSSRSSGDRQRRTGAGYLLAVIVGVNCGSSLLRGRAGDVDARLPDGDRAPHRVPPALARPPSASSLSWSSAYRSSSPGRRHGPVRLRLARLEWARRGRWRPRRPGVRGG
jgi:hypothetical protein